MKNAASPPPRRSIMITNSLNLGCAGDAQPCSFSLYFLILKKKDYYKYILNVISYILYFIYKFFFIFSSERKTLSSELVHFPRGPDVFTSNPIFLYFFFQKTKIIIKVYVIIYILFDFYKI